MNGVLYRTVRLLGAPFRYHLVGAEHIQDNGPALYVANHAASAGPIATILSLPVRFYPWVIGEMTDHSRAPRYLYDDFVHPSWRLGGRFGLAVSLLVARVAVALINGLGSVPVDRNRGRYMEPFRRSLALLRRGDNLLIFPEDPARPEDADTQLRPFMYGFLLLCSLYERETGRRLPVYPVAVQPETHCLAVGAPLYYQEQSSRREGLRLLGARLQREIGELLRRLRAGCGGGG